MVWPFFTIEEEGESGANGSTVNQPKHKEIAHEEASKTVEEAFECDYERDCTPLYKSIEEALNPDDFEPIIRFLDTGYWPNSFFQDAIPPADQAKTWVTRFDVEDSNKVKWSQLPLHLAIVCGAPSAVIGRLVKLYPQALRCTDDQHMLPLHLALRHNADDEIIAFLLMRFPDAVNAKGKNGRSAVDCALRAKDKLRGKILEIFVEKTMMKSKSGAAKENKVLKAEIERKNEEMDKLKADVDNWKSDYEAMKALKDSMEGDLLLKIQELEQAKAEMEMEANEKIEKLKSEKLLHSLELQRKFEDFENNRRELEEKERKAREEEAALQAELATVQERVAASVSPDDWSTLKHEVEKLQAYRLKHTRSETKAKIQSLKEDLEKTMQMTKDTTVDSIDSKSVGTANRNATTELNSMKKNLKKLEESQSNAKTSSELVALRNEVDQLKAELRERSEASKTKLELVMLKKAMETELKNVQGKTKEDIVALQKAIEAANPDRLENKTNDELNAMKSELEAMKTQLQQKELITQTKKDLDDLKTSLDTKIDAETDKTSKSQLQTMKNTVNNLAAKLSNSKSNDELFVIKKEVEDVKENLKKKETSEKITIEALALKKTLEDELKRSEGKTRKELQTMQRTIKNFSSSRLLEEKSIDELGSLKAELNAMKEKLREVERFSKAQEEIEELKKTLAEELKATAGKTDEELKAMKKAVDAIKLERVESKLLKTSLEKEIKKTSGKTEEELLKLKKTLDNISLTELEKKTEWENMQRELQAVKAELMEKKAAHAACAAKDILDLKNVVEDLKRNQKSTKDDEVEALRREMEALKESLKYKESGEAMLKKELESLKDSKLKKKAGIKKIFGRKFSLKHPELAAADSNESEYSRFSHTDGPKTFLPPSMKKSKYAETVEKKDSNESSDERSEMASLVARERVIRSSLQTPVVETVDSKESEIPADMAGADALSPMSQVSFAEPEKESVEPTAAEKPEEPAPQTTEDSAAEKTDETVPKAEEKNTKEKAKKPFLLKRIISSNSKNKTSSMRKVKSMDPRLVQSSSDTSKSTDPTPPTVEMRRTQSRPVVSASGEVEFETFSVPPSAEQQKVEQPKVEV